MAGLRVGYGLAAAELVAAFDRVRNHFGLGRIAQAGGLAALQDRDWLAEVQARSQRARARIGQIALDNELAALPSATNFVTVDCGQTGTFARAVLRELVLRGVFVRMPIVAPLDRCIRISLGDDAAMDILAQTLPAALTSARC